MNEKLIKQFEAYSTFNEQEEKDKEFFLRALKTFDDVLSRENVLLHFCSSAFVNVSKGLPNNSSINSSSTLG